MNTGSFSKNMNPSKIIYVYNSLLILASIFFIINPVFSQDENENTSKDPNTQINVIIEYDDEGNLTRYDSTYTWSWSGDAYLIDFDSLMDNWNQHFREFEFYLNDPQAGWFENSDYMFDFNDLDSTFSEYYQQWDEEFQQQQQEFLKHREEFMEHFQNYMDEHRKLIEKYFNDPLMEEGDTIPDPTGTQNPSQQKNIKNIKIKTI